MAASLDTILKRIPDYRDAMGAHRELLLANALLFGEIPAPTFGEEARIRFLSDRFIESGLENISIDEAGNGLALLPGTEGKRNILVFAHADTVFNAKVDHAMSVGPDRITGPGIGDNSLGLAAVATLPVLLERLKIRLRDNLILMGSVQSLGHGDLGGLRFFLEHNKRPLRAGVCVEGIHLGRLSYASIGMLRGEIDLTVPPEYDWTKFGATGAVAILSKVVRRILEIPLPMEPKTRILFGSMNAGTSFGTQPTMANLRFEVRSEQEGMVTQIRSSIGEIIEEIASGSSTRIELSVIAQRKPGGLAYAHPLVRTMRAILKSLEIEPYVAPSVGEISELIERGIPAVTLGLTRGKAKNEFTESIEIEPMFAGLAQLVALLRSIDKGLCHE
jgi:acetylornithine deacetylase/succinyl-diaminopimelate desuccinylase-like protein